MKRLRNARFLVLPTLAAMLWIAAAHADPPACQIGGVETILGTTPFGVSFQALTAGGDPPLVFHWDFGDGTTSTEQNPYHLYTQPGILDAVLTVTPDGVPEAACRDTATLYLDMIIDPYCVQSASETWSGTADPIVFITQPALLFAPGPYVWRWSFGDGTTRTLHTEDLFQPVEPWAHGYAEPGTYWAAVTVETAWGSSRCFPTALRITTLVPQPPVAVAPAAPASALRLEPPRPNPFGLATTLAYALPRGGRVRLAIFDPQGRRVATLADGPRGAGRHIAVWQGRADTGQRVPAGVYIAVLEQGGRSRSVRIVRTP